MTMIRNFFKFLFSLHFITLIIIFAIAGCAGYFSIVGLMLIWSGAPLAVAFMAGSLEVGKLIITSIVFNYWRKLPILLTTYAIIAIIGLMAITSGGIYGFLSAAYQKGQGPLLHATQQLEMIEQDLQIKQARIEQMDRIIDKINPDYITKRIEEKKQQQPEREQLRLRIEELQQQKMELSNKKLETEIHIGPILKIAEAFNISPDRASHILIMIFVFVFDPLAIALTLCLNVIIREKNNKTLNSHVNLNDETSNLTQIQHHLNTLSNIVDQINKRLDESVTPNSNTDQLDPVYNQLSFQINQMQSDIATLHDLLNTNNVGVVGDVNIHDIYTKISTVQASIDELKHCTELLQKTDKQLFQSINDLARVIHFPNLKMELKQEIEEIQQIVPFKTTI